MSKTYLLTGATSGIGKAIYQKLLDEGHRVIVTLRSEDRLPLLPQKPFQHIVLDFEKPEDVEQALKGLKQPLDGIINAAGLLQGNNYLESSAESLSTLFNINVISPMLMLKHAAPALNENSCVVLFGSVSGHKGSYDDGYAASKGAIHSLVRSMSSKLAPKTRVVGIAPGMTEHTRMTDELVEGRFEHNLKTIPMGKAGQPSDIAELVSFVMSDQCQFMTGNVIDINGGQYLRT